MHYRQTQTLQQTIKFSMMGALGFRSKRATDRICAVKDMKLPFIAPADLSSSINHTSLSCSSKFDSAIRSNIATAAHSGMSRSCAKSMSDSLAVPPVFIAVSCKFGVEVSMRHEFHHHERLLFLYASSDELKHYILIS